jgi:hypothetical protein
MKKSRLLEIVREEIAAALNEESNVTVTNAKGETDVMAYNTPADKAEIARLKKDSNIKSIKTTGGQKIKEDQLNETPIYDISDMEGFKSTLNKFRDENTSKSKALNLLLTKLEDEGTVDTNQLSKDMGVDTATFNNQEIRKFLNRPEDEYFENPKTGEELPNFTPYLSKSDKKRGKVAGEKTEKEPKVAKEPKISEPKVSEPKATETDKAAAAASKTPKLDKIANDKDALLKTQTQTKDKMKELASKIKGAEGTEREDLMGELKKLNKLNGEIQSKLDKLF